MQEKLHAAPESMSKYIVMAAKLVAPRINPSSTEAGFHWCMEEVMRAKLPEFAHGVLMAKAAHFLAAGQMDKAVEVLKQFEKHSGAARTKAATNLSFIYLLEGNITEAERYANLAKQNDEYHTQVKASHLQCGISTINLLELCEK
jgi:intraflagellar transport protein 88